MTTPMKPRNGNAPLWLVAHDFSPCADAAADLALDDLMRSREGGRVVLMHAFVVTLPVAGPEGVPVVGGFLELERAALAESTRRLERVADRLRARQKERSGGLAADAGTLVDIEIRAHAGTPAEAILEDAELLGADRVVVGTHGRTGVKHWLLGSVAERVVRRARVPVLVAHTQKQ